MINSLFSIENIFYNDEYIKENLEWIYHAWKISILIVILYLLLILIGRQYMKNRKAYNLKRELILWNIGLAIFSWIGTLRLLPEFINTIKQHGITHSYCDKDFAYGITACWSWLFMYSKIPELIDTIFIILRKQKLIFLHWYHHATVLLYTWYGAHTYTSTGRWFILMNYMVHAMMYSYYACKAMKIKINRKIMMMITCAQISQMVIGIIINIFAYYKKSKGIDCYVEYNNIAWSLIMYFSYFILFVYFFVKTYF